MRVRGQEAIVNAAPKPESTTWSLPDRRFGMRPASRSLSLDKAEEASEQGPPEPETRPANEFPGD